MTCAVVVDFAGFSAPKVVGSYFTVGDATAEALCGDPTFFGGLVSYLNGPIEADSSLRIAVDPSDASGGTVWVVTHSVPVDCPHDDRLRLGFWFNPDPAPGTPPEDLDLAGTGADPAAIRGFLSHFHLCPAAR